MSKSWKLTKPSAFPGSAGAKPGQRRQNAKWSWEGFKRQLGNPVHGGSLAVFRIAVGIVMSLEAFSLCRPNKAALSYGTTPLETYYTGTNLSFHFPFEGFDWLPLFPPACIYAIVGIQALAGILMALGLFYRLAATATFLSWFYLWVVESTRTYWQSHYYLEVLLTFLLIWMPAARVYSLDAWRARKQPALNRVPYWTLVLLRGQLAIAYFYAGVAKLTYDWIFDSIPVRWYLAEPGVTEPFRPWLSAGAFEGFSRLVHTPGFAGFLSLAGLVFDLIIGPLLLFRRTRILGLVLMGVFHCTNHVLIFDDIGWFPLVGVLTSLIFLDADWPERFWNWVRHPRLAKPDWKWFTAGAVLCPILGAVLGWKLKPTPSSDGGQPLRLASWTALFVLVWLTIQFVIPSRHYLIPGDGRFTYEGMSFSWRLKSEDRHAHSQHLHLGDPGILWTNAGHHAHIRWSAWHEPKVLYHKASLGSIDWSQLPEIAVVFEPLSGERIVYNPIAAGATIKTESEARQRISFIWQTLYGRAPDKIERAISLSGVLRLLADGLRTGGMPDVASRLTALGERLLRANEKELPAAVAQASAVLRELQVRDSSGAVRSVVRMLQPFALEGQRSDPVPFLILQDSALLDGGAQRIDPGLWKTGTFTRGLRDATIVHEGGEPMVIYTRQLTSEMLAQLPRAAIFDALERPDRPPHIWWNSVKDLPSSKLLHTSVQPFYLRRYARRVADLWQQEYGRRPGVHAMTSMSLNGRPHQTLVDPDADLASVRVTWFGHNSWIRDLETPRIPREALLKRPARAPDE